MTKKLLRLSAILAIMVAAIQAPTAAQSLPEQASDTGEENANTHGPDGLALYRPGRPSANHPYQVDHPAAWDPAQYDGVALGADHQPDHLATPTVHAIYLYPSNASSRFAKFAAMFQADAAQASKLVEGLYGTGVRFDMRKGGATPKNPDGVFLDITVLKSKYNAKQLGSSRQFTLVRDELIAKGFTDPDKKYANQKRTTAIVYRPYSTTNTDGGFCRGRTLLHEVGHNLGALQNVATNTSDGAHCNDDNNDVMCYTDSEQFTSDGSKFDYLNNDYWDPPGGFPLPHWTVNLSRFVCTTSNCSGFNLSP